MTTQQNSSTNSLYEVLPETQLDQIQGGCRPTPGPDQRRERPQDFTLERLSDLPI